MPSHHFCQYFSHHFQPTKTYFRSIFPPNASNYRSKSSSTFKGRFSFGKVKPAPIMNPIDYGHSFLADSHIIATLKKVLNPNFHQLKDIFHTYGYSLRLVGGGVRDLLLGKLPKDIDLATECVPHEIIQICKNHRLRYIPTGIDHGTITVVLQGVPCEITTLRVDSEHDGRWAQCSWTRDWREDALRRDLTINSMSMDFEGRVFDYFEGYQDLMSGRVRFVGDVNSRVTEDFLRILRYFRFHARFSSTFAHEPLTADAIRKHAHGLKAISAERKRAEYLAILAGPHPLIETQAIYDLGLPEYLPLPEPFLKQDFSRACQLIPASPVLIFASLFPSKQLFSQYASLWKFANLDRRAGEHFLSILPPVFPLFSAPAETTFLPGQLLSLKQFHALFYTIPNMEKETLQSCALYQGTPEIAQKIIEWVPQKVPRFGAVISEIDAIPSFQRGLIVRYLTLLWIESDFKTDIDAIHAYDFTGVNFEQIENACSHYQSHFCSPSQQFATIHLEKILPRKNYSIHIE